MHTLKLELAVMCYSLRLSTDSWVLFPSSFCSSDSALSLKPSPKFLNAILRELKFCLSLKKTTSFPKPKSWNFGWNLSSGPAFFLQAQNDLVVPPGRPLPSHCFSWPIQKFCLVVTVSQHGHFQVLSAGVATEVKLNGPLLVTFIKRLLYLEVRLFL